MRLLFVADGRSPIAQNWIEYFARRGHEVHLVSTFACQPDFPVASYEFLPVAFSGLKKQASSPITHPQRTSIWGAAAVGLRSTIRHWLGTYTLPSAGRKLQQIISRVKPDLLHAMRIPYEGMLASRARIDAPLVVSVWGNDFTLHARSNPLMGAATRRTLETAEALHTDCERDQRLARRWGFASEKPHIVLPSGGGVQLEIFYPPEEWSADPVIINPRGFRAYVKSDTFFRAVPLILRSLPHARFICPAMLDELQAHKWVEELGISQAVELLPSMPRVQMAKQYRRAQVMVSITTHDGTPNTLLEGMACGCFPICGDLESIREWIDPGENGTLVDPGDPNALAEAVISSYQADDQRRRAIEINSKLIAQKAEHSHVMLSAESFYGTLI